MYLHSERWLILAADQAFNRPGAAGFAGTRSALRQWLSDPANTFRCDAGRTLPCSGAGLLVSAKPVLTIIGALIGVKLLLQFHQLRSSGMLNGDRAWSAGHAENQENSGCNDVSHDQSLPRILATENKFVLALFPKGMQGTIMSSGHDL